MLLKKTDLEKLKETLDAIGKKYDIDYDYDRKDYKLFLLSNDEPFSPSFREKTIKKDCLAMSFYKGKFIKSWMTNYRDAYCIFLGGIGDFEKYFNK